MRRRRPLIQERCLRVGCWLSACKSGDVLCKAFYFSLPGEVSLCDSSAGLTRGPETKMRLASLESPCAGNAISNVIKLTSTEGDATQVVWDSDQVLARSAPVQQTIWRQRRTKNCQAFKTYCPLWNLFQPIASSQVLDDSRRLVKGTQEKGHRLTAHFWRETSQGDVQPLPRASDWTSLNTNRRSIPGEKATVLEPVHRLPGGDADSDFLVPTAALAPPSGHEQKDSTGCEMYLFN
ncbi:uncharacterized protein LOC127594086 isoform X1 [Hippocampus zosterae]|uniref:uncharacterized protein LOC127594086 isoform X1 n=1 Tax=Hippocampus zosterae TaxID=109293 RepID=UPI00223D5E2B|nr:uncharacterized protein LOC127594086 isoform X1 [Hippocampus zosterae]